MKNNKKKLILITVLTILPSLYIGTAAGISFKGADQRDISGDEIQANTQRAKTLYDEIQKRLKIRDDIYKKYYNKGQALQTENSRSPIGDYMAQSAKIFEDQKTELAENDKIIEPLQRENGRILDILAKDKEDMKQFIRNVLNMIMPFLAGQIPFSMMVAAILQDDGGGLDLLIKATDTNARLNALAPQ